MANILAVTENMPYEDWLEWRKKGVGGSDASVVCGISRYKSPVELWLDKTGQLPYQEAGEAAYWGTHLEALVRAEFTKRTGIEVEHKGVLLQSEEYPFMLANLDGTCEHPEYGTCIFEAKTASAYPELRAVFREWEHSCPVDHLTAHIIFTVDSFDREYPLLSRTYAVSSNNKAFRPHMGGYSIFGDSLDGTDIGVRLEGYMAEEGNPGGWQVDGCYILEQMRDAAAIPNLSGAEQKDGIVCCFFGDTTIRAKETVKDGRLYLTPISGDQVGPDGWGDLEMDRVYGYCTLLERQLNKK